jgi:adenylate cyclase
VLVPPGETWVAREQRKLAAIVCADVAGYSSLIGHDEEGTLGRLKALRRELINPLIAQHGGRIANTAGDSLLIEFPSAVEAVRCAIAVQNGVAAHYQGSGTGRDIRFRIGVNVGDVVAQGDDLLGDGVNIAARLESLADPGGIVLSRAARDQVRDRMQIELGDLGEIEVKNIARPIRAFAVRGLSANVPPAPVPMSGTRGPKLAVFVFDSYSPELQSVDLARGLTEDVITDLSKFEHLFVIGPVEGNDTKSARPSAIEVGRVSGADYVLTGNLRAVGDNIRLVASLVDAKTGQQVWNERFDRSLRSQGFFEIQDAVVQRIVAIIASDFGVLTKHRFADMRGRPPQSLAAYECVLQAQKFFTNFLPDDFVAARACLRSTIEREPGYATAWAWYGGLLQEQVAQDFDPSQTDSLDQARVAIDKALELAPNSQLAHLFLVEDYFHRRRLDQAIRTADHTIELNPQNVGLVMTMGFFIALSGECDRGVEIIRRTEAISPYLPAWRHQAPAVCAVRQRHYTAALREIEKAPINLPHMIILHAASLAQLGRLDDASRAFAQGAALGLKLADFWKNTAHYWYEDALIAEISTALGKAGVNFRTA